MDENGEKDWRGQSRIQVKAEEGDVKPIELNPYDEHSHYLSQ